MVILLFSQLYSFSYSKNWFLKKSIFNILLITYNGKESEKEYIYIHTHTHIYTHTHTYACL